MPNNHPVGLQSHSPPLHSCTHLQSAVAEKLQRELLMAEQRREVLERLERQARVVVVAEVDVAEYKGHHVVLEHVTQPLVRG